MKHLIIIALLMSTAFAKPEPKLSKEDKLINDLLALKKGAVSMKIRIYKNIKDFSVTIRLQWEEKKQKKIMPKEKDVKILLKQARKDGFTIVKYNYQSGILYIVINKVKKTEVDLE